MTCIVRWRGCGCGGEGFNGVGSIGIVHANPLSALGAPIDIGRLIPSNNLLDLGE